MDMPSTYNQDPYAQTSIVDVNYVKEVRGWVRIAEIVLSLIAFICATVSEAFVRHWGGGWVQFVSITAFIICIILTILHMFRLMQQMPSSIPVLLVELVIVAVYTVFYFISGIVAAVKGSREAAIGACAFFCFASMVAFAGDTFLMFMQWRGMNSGGLPAAGSTTNTTTTVTTSSSGMPSGGANAGSYAVDSRQDKAVY